MSPDVEWHIGEEAEQETISNTAPARRSRRRWIAIVVVVILGAGLGIVYRSIPEPASRPAPTPSPTLRPTPTGPAVPANLYDTIDREAQALASGAIETVMSLHTPQEREAADRQRLNFRAWSRPTDDRPLYTIIDFNLRSPTKAWADIRQFRNGRWFRETRFYRWEDDRWLRSDPDPFFWSDRAETLDSLHFHVIYAVEDRELIPPVIEQLEEVYDSLCRDLGCGAQPPTYTLSFNSGVSGRWPSSAHGRDIRFVSPRVTGVYEDATPLSEESNLIWALAWATAEHVVYEENPSNTNSQAMAALEWAIVNWAADRAAHWPDLKWISGVKTELQQQPVTLKTVWEGAVESNDRIFRLAYAIIRFIDQEYGAPAMSKVLKSLRAAQSFADVIEHGLGVSFEEFEQKWQAWLRASTR